MISGFNSSSTLNSTTILTNVLLSKNNFKVIGKVKGTANNWYLFLLFGGMNLITNHLITNHLITNHLVTNHLVTNHLVI